MMTRSPASPLSAPWGEHALPDEGEAHVEIGPLSVTIRASDGEVWIAHRPGDGTRGEARSVTAGPPEEPDWVRWPVPEDTDTLSFSPAFASRPVVVEPELTFRLLPRSRARIFVRVPLWVRVEIPGGETTTLTEFPSMILSDTWWGGFTEGEICHWIPTTARRRPDPEVFAPHLAMCPVQLSNRSDEELQVEKIALRVPHLSIFGRDGRLWADETRVRYRGADEESDIEIAGEAPAEEREARLVTGPRSPLPRGFRARSFARLKSLPGLGG